MPQDPDDATRVLRDPASPHGADDARSVLGAGRGDDAVQRDPRSEDHARSEDGAGLGGAIPSSTRAEGPARQTGEQPVAPATIGEVGGYRLLERLGSGGMGTVYSAIDGDGHRVALKRIHPHIAEEPATRERLQREVALLHRVRESGVARVLDAEVDAAEAFIVTELIDGPTLEQDVNAHGPFAADELSGLAHGLAGALRAIHAAGIVHRDLKPSNVMLSADGPVLIDFGIAQVVDDARLTQTGMVTGTPGYVDPELIAGAEPVPEHDWWAWAALLVFAGGGHPPFGSGTMAAVLARVTTGNVDTLDVPEPVATALISALDPDPRNRLPVDDVLKVIDGHWSASDLAQATSVLAVDAARDTTWREDGGGWRRDENAGHQDGGATRGLDADGTRRIGAGDGMRGAAAGRPMPPSFPPGGPGAGAAGGGAGVAPGGDENALYGASPRHDERPRYDEPRARVAQSGYDEPRARVAQSGYDARPGQQPRRTQTGPPGYQSHEPQQSPQGHQLQPTPSYQGRRLQPGHPGYQGHQPNPPHPAYGVAAPYGAPGGSVAYPFGPVPEWLREPPRHGLTVALVFLGLSPLAAVRPGIAVVVALVAFVVLGTFGSNARAKRGWWRRRDRRAGDTARGLARLPWDALLAILAALLGVLLGAVSGVLMYYVGEGLFQNSYYARELTAWASVSLGTLVAWLTPTSFVQRLGARELLSIGRGSGGGRHGAGRMLRVVLLIAAIAAGAGMVWAIMQGLVPQQWAPLTEPVPLGNLFVGP